MYTVCLKELGIPDDVGQPIVLSVSVAKDGKQLANQNVAYLGRIDDKEIVVFVEGWARPWMEREDARSQVDQLTIIGQDIEVGGESPKSEVEVSVGQSDVIEAANKNSSVLGRLFRRK